MNRPRRPILWWMMFDSSIKSIKKTVVNANHFIFQSIYVDEHHLLFSSEKWRIQCGQHVENILFKYSWKSLGRIIYSRNSTFKSIFDIKAASSNAVSSNLITARNWNYLWSFYNSANDLCTVFPSQSFERGGTDAKANQKSVTTLVFYFSYLHNRLPRYSPIIRTEFPARFTSLDIMNMA